MCSVRIPLNRGKNCKKNSGVRNTIESPVAAAAAAVAGWVVGWSRRGRGGQQQQGALSMAGHRTSRFLFVFVKALFLSIEGFSDVKP